MNKLDKQIKETMTFEHYKSLLLFVNHLANEMISVGKISAFDIIYNLIDDVLNKNEDFDSESFIEELDKASCKYVFSDDEDN